MPPVRDLHCVRKSPGNGAAATAIAIAAQPGLDRGRFAGRKNVEDPPPFQILRSGFRTGEGCACLTQSGTAEQDFADSGILQDFHGLVRNELDFTYFAPEAAQIAIIPESANRWHKPQRISAGLARLAVTS